MSVDGVAESNSGGVSLDITTVRFVGCRNVYPTATAKPRKGFANQLPGEEILVRVLKDIIDNEVKLRWVIADAPMKAKLRHQMGHRAAYGCPCCIGEAVSVEIVSSKGVWTKVRVWCLPTLRQPLRTLAALATIYQNYIGRDPRKFQETNKGMLPDPSPLLSHPGFDMLYDMPFEVMHQIYLGVVKQLFGETFRCGDQNAEKSKKALLGMNAGFDKLSVPKEFSRVPRWLDHANFKAEEWRNLSLFYFPHVFDALDGDGTKKNPAAPELSFIWRMLVWKLRLYICDHSDYESLKQPQSDKLTEDLQRRLEHEYGKDIMYYNMHMMSHMDLSRKMGLLTLMSAVAFEAFYAVYKRGFEVGTCSTPKQANQALFMRQLNGRHYCERPIIYKDAATAAKKPNARRTDHIVYTYSGKRGGHQFWRIDQMLGGGRYRCTPFANAPFICPRTKLDFGRVGVYHLGFLMEETEQKLLNRRDFAGKGMMSGDFLMTVPNNILTEC